MNFSYIIAESCESISNKCHCVCERKNVIFVSISPYKWKKRKHFFKYKSDAAYLNKCCPLFQSVHSSPEEFTPFSDSTTRSLWTPSHHFVAPSTSLSSHLVSLWMEISSLSSRCDLTSRDPSSALSSTTSGTSLPTCMTVTEVIHCAAVMFFFPHHPFNDSDLKVEFSKYFTSFIYTFMIVAPLMKSTGDGA